MWLHRNSCYLLQWGAECKVFVPSFAFSKYCKNSIMMQIFLPKILQCPRILHNGWTSAILKCDDIVKPKFKKLVYNGTLVSLNQHVKCHICFVKCRNAKYILVEVFITGYMTNSNSLSKLPFSTPLVLFPFNAMFPNVFCHCYEKGMGKCPYCWAVCVWIHWWLVVSPHKGPVIRKACPCHDVIMYTFNACSQSTSHIRHTYDT